MSSIIGVGATAYYASNAGGILSPDFIFTVETTGASELFTIPCRDVGVFNAVVDWGDGGPTSDITTFNDVDLAHTYLVADIYQISISGTFPNIYFNNTGVHKDKLRTVLNLGSVGWLNLLSAFYGCSGLTSVSAPNTDTSLVTNMSGMYRTCPALTFVDETNIDKSLVTNRSLMYRSAGALQNVNISEDNISSLTNASNMLLGTLLPSLSVALYDATLINWEAQPHQPNVTAHFGTSKYTGGSPAATARAALVADGWTITDGGIA